MLNILSSRHNTCLNAINEASVRACVRERNDTLPHTLLSQYNVHDICYMHMMRGSEARLSRLRLHSYTDTQARAHTAFLKINTDTRERASERACTRAHAHCSLASTVPSSLSVSLSLSLSLSHSPPPTPTPRYIPLSLSFPHSPSIHLSPPLFLPLL